MLLVPCTPRWMYVLMNILTFMETIEHQHKKGRTKESEPGILCCCNGLTFCWIDENGSLLAVANLSGSVCENRLFIEGVTKYFISTIIHIYGQSYFLANNDILSICYVILNGNMSLVALLFSTGYGDKKQFVFFLNNFVDRKSVV